MPLVTCILLLVLSLAPCSGAWSAPIQTKAIGSTTGVASQAASFTSTPTVGHVVIVGISIGGTTGVPAPSTVVDNQGNGYSQIGSSPRVQGQSSVFIWCGVATVSSGTFTVTVTPTASYFTSVVLLEYSGGTCNPDVPPALATGATSPYSCGSFTANTATDLLLTALDINSASSLTFTAPSGFTTEASVTNGVLSQPIAIADQVLTVTATFTPTWTVSANAATNCLFVALLPAGASGMPASRIFTGQ